MNRGSISFEDAYGLQLIASNPNGVDRNVILQHLSAEAKRIGKTIMRQESASKDKMSAKRTLKVARKK